MHIGLLLVALWRTLALLAGQADVALGSCMDYQECRTFGSGVVAPFQGDWYHVRTSCSFIVTRFTHQAVQVEVTAQRGLKGLMSYVSIVINKIRTIVDLDGKITVDKNMVSLPYDHTYQHIFPYGAYTRLSSTVLPLTITWHSSSQGISSLWVQWHGDMNISAMSGLCGQLNVPALPSSLILSSVTADGTCLIEDSLEDVDRDCQRVMSISLGCIGMKTKHYFHLCRKNSFGQASNLNVTCPFYRDLAHMCGPGTATWNEWRDFTSCPELMCPGDLTFQELGNAFIPTCSNPKPRTCPQDMTSTCVCPPGMLLNDREEGHRCVSLSECPCVHYNKVYPPGSNRTTKCQNCLCVNGRWYCSDDICPRKCSIESQFVKTFDGKHFRIPGRCSYVAAQGANWTMLIHFDDQSIKLKKVEIHHDGDVLMFSNSMVTFQGKEIKDFLYSPVKGIVFWQSSMYVQIICHSGLSIQVQMSPEIQVYLYLPDSQRETTSGLCGNFNGDSGDDFTTSSGIVENSAEAFALSWSLGACTPDINPICTDMDKEMFAEQHCKVLKDYSGVFSSCHPYVPYEKYYEACLTRTCQCHSVPHSCLCVALGNYAKACAYVGKPVGDWRTETNCTVMCTANQVFSYSTSSCNRTCHSVTGPDPTCMMMDGSGMETEMAVAPVEGCGCPAGSYRNSLGSCVPTSLCDCYSGGMTVPPGRSTINGLSCFCEHTQLSCRPPAFCRACKPDQVCVDCLGSTNNTSQNTCDGLGLPIILPQCFPGCYCPTGTYLSHRGECVSANNCTCMFSGTIYGPGESVKSDCKTCTCTGGRWHCTGEPCPGKCQVFGNGHYQTFDYKWYSFNGNCEYTLVEDDCGSGIGTFAVRVESIPCCDEELTCSRTITLDMENGMHLTFDQSNMSAMHYKKSGSGILVEKVGLYIVASVPSLGLTLIWDRNTRLTVLLARRWKGRVCGLCGNYDASEANDLQGLSPQEFGNSWKTGTPPCSDVRNETFPCETHSYCSHWAQRRCMIITGDTFKACHLKVDPGPYYAACVLEACACQFEGRFLGFCTAVAAYAEACSEQDVCIRWRTPDLCPVFCDYYNKEGQCTWHYDPCGNVPTCGTDYFKGKLEGCFPRCPAETPYYDEKTGQCLTNCTPDCPGNPDCPTPTTTPTTIPTTTPEPCLCKDGDCGIEWTKDCYNYKCDGVVETKTLVPCHPRPMKCPRGSEVTGDKCCNPSRCNCRCEVWSDPHYITFHGTYYRFMGACTYTLVQERVPQYNFSVMVDNAHCFGKTTVSCARGVWITFRHLSIHIIQESFWSRPYAMLNNDTVDSHLEKYGIRFDVGPGSVSVYIDQIRSHISMATGARVTITLGMEYFQNNTEGQCGVCGGASCVRPSGRVEEDYCCPETAYDWIVPDPRKPMCNAAPRNVSCDVTPPPPTTPCPDASVCDILYGPVFEECRRLVDLSRLYESCRFDVCNTLPNVSCSSFAQAAELCQSVDVCVDWCKHTNGFCELCPCKDGDCGIEWTKDCYNYKCDGGVETKTPVPCHPRPMKCPRGSEVTGDKCCNPSRCNCRCEVWSDPHYITFHGTYYRFMGACTYTLVQERVPQHNFSVMVDNAHCFGKTTVSCARGVWITFRHLSIHIIQESFWSRPYAMLNNDTVDSHLEKYGIRFDVGPGSVSVYIDQIRSHISMATGARVTITLGMEYFQNNTEGQCGVCGGASCVRPSGRVEEDYCCPETAYDWIVPDPRKPMCNAAPRNVSCDVTPPPPTTPCPDASVCDILYGPVFEECRRLVDLSRLYESCRFDVCNTLPNVSCSSFAQAAELCQSVDVCVDWCEHTNGFCDCYVDRASDIAFLLDGSGSISSDDFQTMKDFVIDLIKKLPHMKFAVAQYASGTITHFNFNQFNSSGMFESQINGITRISGGTKTARAICTVVDTLFVPAAGLRNFTTRVLIVITDGQSSDSLQLPDCVAEAEAEDITRYTIGVGQAFNRPDARKELETIASSVDNHVFHVNNFDALESISVALGRTIRDECPPKTTVPPTHHPPTTTPVTTTMTTTTITMETTTTTLPPTTTPTPSTTMTTTPPPTTTLTPSTTMTTTLPPTTTPTPSTTMTTTLPPTTTPTPSTTMTTTLRATHWVITQSTAKPTTSEMYWSTTPPCGCLDSNNVRRRVGEIWMESCRTLECLDGGAVKMTPVPCPELTTPACPGGKVVTVMGECCAMRKCFCECVVSGDPHYYTFSGLNYDFMGACTYTLVQEPHGMTGLAFSIVVDNEFCFGIPTVSCAKGILITFRGFLIHLILDSLFGTPYVTLNGSRVNPPANLEFFDFENIPNGVSVHIVQPGIYVSMQTGGHVVIRLNYQFFRNNTEGQCGVCGGPPCVRPNGVVENGDCCPMTAYDWKVDDPTKPMCKNASRNVPCGPPLPPPTPCPESDVCDKIFDIIGKCESDISVKDVEALMKNCRFDVCNIPNITCFYLERAAELCPECIKWRHLVNGMCNGSCENGMVYEECREVSDDHCCGSVRAPGRSFIDPHSGCFCPKNQARAGPHGQCVDICTDCQDPYGYPKQPGDTWEVDCNICTCDNLTRSTQCVKRPISLPRCTPGSTITPTGCCGEQTCTPLPVPPKSLCGVVMKPLRINYGACTTSIVVPICTGSCPDNPRFEIGMDGFVTVKKDHFVCQMLKYEDRTVPLCGGSVTFIYKNITACDCQPKVSPPVPLGRLV